MKENVYFIKSDGLDEQGLSLKILKTISEHGLLDFISKNDMTAVKTHFGEAAGNGFVRPIHIKTIGAEIKKKGALPFITETSTLYKGNRSNAVSHIHLANKHGFGYENTGLPIIMADGLFGDEETEIEINGRIYKSVNVAKAIAAAQSMVVFSHFTGHLAAGFGAALKNLGMGCTSRKAKLIQHSTARPSIKVSKCTLCGQCEKWCPAGAITLNEKSAVIKNSKCIGCGQCLAVCRFDSVGYNWGATYEDLQKKVVEHAMGVALPKKNKILFINFLTRISKDCDCMTSFEKICDDIGVLLSFDPVAIDASSLDLVEKYTGRKFSELSFDIPYKFQIDYSREIGFGNPDYELIEV